MTNSSFYRGVWTWDVVEDCLKFNSFDDAGKSRSVSATATVLSKVVSHKTITFRTIVENLDQIRFRRRYQRTCGRDEPEVVTIQDVKDVALFLANKADLTVDFINYFHTPTIDRFLRALIVYFQYYIQIWDDMTKRREESFQRKLWHPRVQEVQDAIRDNLAELRSLVAREYCCIITGVEDSKRFHHLNNKNKISLSDRDRHLVEMLLCVVPRVIWIALQRKHLNLIDLELNRLLRGEQFNLCYHNMGRGISTFAKKPEEDRVLKGKIDLKEKMLLQHSPLANEFILGEHDYRLLAIGILEIEPMDERLKYLEIAFAAPEEMLLKSGVAVGILGMPRDEMDAMLTTSRWQEASNVKAPPEFKLPPKKLHGAGGLKPPHCPTADCGFTAAQLLKFDSAETMPKEFPQKPSRFRETRQTIAARQRQCAMWKNYLQQKPSRDSAETYSESTLYLISRSKSGSFGD